MLAVLACLAGCARPAPVEKSTADIKDPPGRFIYLSVDVFACLVEVSRIQYVSDGSGRDTWQSPAETRAAGRGDCEDAAIYFQHLMKKRGYAGEVVFGLKTSVARHGHAWCEYVLEGERYVIEPAVDLFFRRRDLPPSLYVPVRDADSIAERSPSVEGSNVW